MAWRSLYLWFQTFRKETYLDVNAIYRKYLYDEWFNSLSEDEQKKEIEYQKRLKEKREREGKMALAQLLCMTNAMKRIAGRNVDDISYWDIINSLF